MYAAPRSPIKTPRPREADRQAARKHRAPDRRQPRSATAPMTRARPTVRPARPRPATDARSTDYGVNRSRNLESSRPPADTTGPETLSPAQPAVKLAVDFLVPTAARFGEVRLGDVGRDRRCRSPDSGERSTRRRELAGELPSWHPTFRIGFPRLLPPLADGRARARSLAVLGCREQRETSYDPGSRSCSSNAVEVVGGFR